MKQFSTIMRNASKAVTNNMKRAQREETPKRSSTAAISTISAERLAWSTNERAAVGKKNLARWDDLQRRSRARKGKAVQCLPS
jgi:hypothetical protein